MLTPSMACAIRLAVTSSSTENIAFEHHHAWGVRGKSEFHSPLAVSGNGDSPDGKSVVIDRGGRMRWAVPCWNC